MFLLKILKEILMSIQHPSENPLGDPDGHPTEALEGQPP